MQLKVLASGSKGNCYLLYTDKGIVILEAGVRWQGVLKAIEYRVDQVICCLITHEHMDHARHMLDYANGGVSVYASAGTIAALHEIGALPKPYLIRSFEKMKQVELYGVSFTAFPTQHDAVDPVGYYIVDHGSSDTLLFATDTYYVRYRFKNLRYIMVECNYAEDLLSRNIESNHINGSLAKRIRGSHFELNNVKEFIRGCENLRLTDVVLLHLSDVNSDAERFKKEIASCTMANVHLAEKGLNLTLGGIYEANL